VRRRIRTTAVSFFIIVDDKPWIGFERHRSRRASHSTDPRANARAVRTRAHATRTALWRAASDGAPRRRGQRQRGARRANPTRIITSPDDDDRDDERANDRGRRDAFNAYVPTRESVGARSATA